MGLGVAQYPALLPGVTVADAEATDAVLAATLAALGVGAALLVLWHADQGTGMRARVPGERHTRGFPEPLRGAEDEVTRLAAKR